MYTRAPDTHDLGKTCTLKVSEGNWTMPYAIVSSAPPQKIDGVTKKPIKNKDYMFFSLATKQQALHRI